MDRVFWNNTLMAYLIVAGSIIIAWIIIRLLKKVVLQWIRRFTTRSDNRYDDIALSVVEKFVLPYVYLLINYQIILQLNLHPRIERVLHVAMGIISVFFAIRLINHTLQLAFNGVLKRRNESPHRIRQVNGILNIIKAVIWLTGLVFFLDNIGYNVTTIIAGLGIGGIAIALAAQTILGDFFNYFVIFFDKPFEIGDTITVGNENGVIEHIGIKTTRLRALSGEQLIMANTDLTKLTVHNFQRLEKRRIAFRLTVVYQVNKEQLLSIPVMIESIVKKMPEVQFDRVHLLSFGSSGIDFEIVYFYLNADFNKYMDTHQSILYSIFESFENAGIRFAYPTQTVFLEKDSIRPGDK